MGDLVRGARQLSKIAEVEPLAGSHVAVTWYAGDREVIDLTPVLLSRRSFFPLRTDEALFRTVFISKHGIALQWSNGVAISAAWIAELRPLNFTNNDFRIAMNYLQMSLNGMAARLGISRRLIADYRKDRPIPPTIAYAVLYLLAQRQRVPVHGD